MVDRTVRLSYWLPPKHSYLAVRMALAGLLVALLTGCQTRQLVPTPNLYLNTSIDPFEEVPEVYRNNEVDVLYLTDRKQKGQRENYVEYGVERSLSEFPRKPTLRGDSQLCPGAQADPCQCRWPARAV